MNREFICTSFSQYVPSTVVKQLIDSPTRLSLVGQRRELSLMFMGDGSFSIFNAPIDQPDHARRAVLCAIQLDAFARAFAADRQREGIPFGVTRIGLHSGEAQVGNFGSFARKEYGAIGDAVNTAARLESVNKLFGTRICVSEATVHLCPDLRFRPLAEVVVKGKSVPITIFEPLDASDLPPSGVEAYLAAYEALRRRHDAAQAAFDALHAQFPDDPVIATHRDRLLRGETGASISLEIK